MYWAGVGGECQNTLHKAFCGPLSARGPELKPQKDLRARGGVGWRGMEAIPPHISALSRKVVCFSASASGLGGFQISSEGDRTNEEGEKGGWGGGEEREIKYNKTNPSLVKKYPTASPGPASARRLANLAFIELEWN